MTLSALPPPGEVAACRAAGDARYPDHPPYHPGESYPEYPFPGRLSTRPNAAYDGVRGALRLLGLDRERFGTRDWNPLGALIRPGDRVVIKPNMVRDFHEDPRAGTEALVTHGSVVRAVVDYAYLALGGRGGLTVCDSPQNDGDWDGLWRAFRFDELLAFYREAAPGFELRIHDVRKEAVRKVHGVAVDRYARPGDPAGYVAVDLGDDSEFADGPERTGRLYGAEYDISQTAEHHRPGRHEYLIGRSFLDADVILNVPKWKTHKKSGVTVWIKSVIGICGDKNWLPHHTEGTPGEGGDQFPADTMKYRAEQRVVAATKRVLRHAGRTGKYVGAFMRRMGAHVFGDTNKDAIRSGNWHGNDTIWRTVLDLHKCWIYADRDGVLRKTPQRRFLCVVDGIVGGEGNGPLAPRARHDGVVLAGTDPVAMDTAATVLMGFDPDRLPILTRAPRARGFALARVTREEIRVRSNRPEWDAPLAELKHPMDWQPHFGWVGIIERAERRPPIHGRAGAGPRA